MIKLKVTTPREHLEQTIIRLEKIKYNVGYMSIDLGKQIEYEVLQDLREIHSRLVEIDKLKSSNKKLSSTIKDLNKKVTSLEMSLLGTEAMNTYQKAEKDVQAYSKHTKNGDKKEKRVV